MACNLLYSTEDKGNLGTHLRSSLRKGSLDAFKNWAKGMKTVPQSSRLVPIASDSDSDVAATRMALSRDLGTILEGWFQTHPDTTLIQADIRRELSEFFELTDSTQPIASDSDTESKTSIEVADKNSASLKAHMLEFYGPEAYNITADLRQNFEDLMTGIAYYDINSGTIADQTTEQLNQNIRTEKARLFRELVTYLKQAFPEDTEIQSLSDKMFQVSKADGEVIFDAHNYFKACNNFYTKVANTPDFRNVLQIANAERVAQTQRTDRTKKYEQLIKVLNADPDFKKLMLDKFGKSRKALVESQLYSADHYSPYYIAAKKYAMTKNIGDALSLIEEIERKDLDVLDAANAYTMLRHFDALVKDIYGDQISIKKNTAGYEDMIPDKYSYHFDSSHQVKSWQTSEDIGSERHTSKFTTAVIKMIRVFDHKTGEYLHRRADNTSVIVAARNLINAVITDNLRFRHETGAIRGTVNEFKENIILFHDDPVVRLQKILELLFEKPKNVVNATSLVDYIENRRGINDYDLSVLKSVYDVVFNKNSDLSFFKQARSKIASNQNITQNLLEEVAGFVDRNVTAAYLETIYDFETGEVDVRAKKKYFNNLQLYKTQVNINNHVNGMSVETGRQLQTDYDFNVVSQTGDKFTHYTATIGGTEFTLDIPNALRGQILAKNLRSGTAMRFDSSSKEAFDRLAKINLINFRDKFLHNPNLLNADEALLRDVLQFLDDTLNLGILSNPNLGLQTLYSYQSIYNPVDGMNNYLMPLMKLGLRAAYANQMYLNAAAAEQSLTKYLTESKNDIYKFHLGDKKSRLFSDRHKNLKFQIASYSDDVLGIWTDAQSILRGEASKATTKDKQGNSIPNNSVAKLGGNLRYYLGKQYGTPTGELLFAKNPDLIKGTYHDLEVTSMQDETKAVKAFSSSELFFHAIFNKFWGSYLKNGTVIIQPTEYSDKTTFLNWEINPTVNKIDLIKGSDNQTTEQLVIDHFLKTVGVTYQNIYNATVNKMQAIAYQYIAEHPDIDASTKYTDVLHLMSERELVNIASRLGLTIELNKDYRIIKDKTGKSVVGMNELLGHNARLYNDAKALAKRFNEEKLLFLEQLMQNGASFQVLEGTDTIEMYTEDKISDYARSRNPVLNTILSYFAKTKDIDGRKQYMKDWVDANTGKLIFAKQNGENIISVADKYNHKENIELNPLLDKFFYVESLMSNNLRYSLTGFEINHAAGKNSPFTRALKCQTIADWNALPCANIAKNDTKTWNKIHNTEKTGILDTVFDLNDLYDILESDALKGQPKVKQALQSLLDVSYIYNTNTSQGTQFKRNVIIPATLQYCLQNTKEGVPPQIKCAVIRDEGAPVWNYRGEHEGEIDACDGSAWITPFQQRLENRSLGSQKVGNIRKPIWHSYDTESGTSYLAKFAVNTMTNQLMKRSLRSKAPLFNLFKKATNLQWDPADGIDLTKALLMSESRGGDGVNNPSYNAWFAQTILEGQQLFYENKYGEVMEITGFNKDILANGQTIYYTLEKSRYGVRPTRKYHIFYDITNSDGKIEKSVHETVATLAQAETRMAELAGTNNNPHAINSLFELHTALGGINCVDANGKGSEFNNDVVVNFMTNVGKAKNGTTNKDYVNQKTYDQPLKNYQIGYLLNSTAVKNGAKNINQSSAWTDNSDLTWFNVNSDGLGMQMNADHDIVDAELTEFSQVIAATAAYGYTYDNCSELYHGLAKTAFQASEATLRAVDNYLQNIDSEQREAATSELYDAVGRIILVNQSIKDNESLTNIILDAVQRIFNKYKNHNLDEIKMPFSDSNLYSDFIATLASTINKQSIKRKHPGSGCPMAPGYNMMQYFELPDGKGGVSKVMIEDVLKRARSEYKTELLTFLRNAGTYDRTLNAVQIGKKTLYLGAMTFEELEQEALKANKGDIPISAYYTAEQDISLANQHVIQEYLHRQQQTILDSDVSYFMPSDIVEVLDENGNVLETVDLDSLDKYYAFKERAALATEPLRYRRSVTSPYNLKPSLIRWQYIAGMDPNTGQQIVKYMNYFDLAHVKDAYLNHTDTNSPEYRKAVQDALNQLHEGTFSLNGLPVKIIPGTLENTEAELVMGNLYQDVFGIEGESLNDVLEQGEQYFLNKAGNLHEPNTEVHDFAFLRDNGKHVLVTIGNVTASNTITENPMDKGIMVNGDGDIYLMSGSRTLFKIGRWANVNDVQYDANNQQFTDANNSNLDPTQYRVLDNGQVQKKFDFVTRYDIVTPKGNNKNKVYQTNTLYKIADINTFKQALTPKAGQTQVSDADAIAQQAKIVSDIFGIADYKMIQINQRKRMSQAKRNAVQNALGRVLESGSKASLDVKNLLRAQLDSFTKDNKPDSKIFNQLKKDFIEKEARKKWVSFQDSLKFISSRIPAQTLQSFMAMKLVGWTGDDSNIAYVSHFQTYLQGSDYDIDKAYIMGQSYDSNGVYVKWSPFFDFTSLQTLEASKQLPIAKNIRVTQVKSNGADITSEITRMLVDAHELVEDGILSTTESSEEQKVDFLNAFRDALRKIERANGRYVYNGSIANEELLDAILKTFQAHENYQVPANLAEAAFKNVASANIHAVSHDIRNRDQAYTAITMNRMREAAEVSPKGEQASLLNMLNPLTKYIMQYQCIVGKNVIGITANGEKFWFNNYYYWTNVAQFGSEADKEYLKFSVVLNRIKGRAQGTQFDPEQAAVTINHIPDLDTRNPLIRKTLIDTFDINPNTENYKYVDQMISQLLSAATDNAKELILAKINASTDFAKMYLILMTLGCDVNDIAAFMTCPLAEFVDSRTNVNMFQSTHGVINATNAINASEGRVYGKSFLHGTILQTDPDSDTGEYVSISKVNAAAYAVRQAIFEKEKESLYNAVMKQLNLGEEDSLDRVNLDDAMQALILTVVENPRILGDGKDYSLLDHVTNYRDSEISNYLRYCQDLIIQLTDTKQKYTGTDKMDQLRSDAAEFRKVFNLANEMSGISAGYLGLNQGIPTSKLEQLKKISQMKRVITDRERLFNISDKELFPDLSELKEKALIRAQDRQRVVWQNLREALKENNSWLSDAIIDDYLKAAHEHGIINNFDVIKMLTDDDYRLATKNYLHIIKGTTNVIDMMEKIPHYKEILNELKAVLVADRALSVKSRLVNQLTEDSTSLTDQQLKGIIRFVDTLNIVDFLRGLKQPIFNVRDAKGAAGVVDGFNPFFDTVKVSAFDLSTQEGIAGFKHFVETEFYDYLRNHHKNNPLVKHLVKSTNDGMTILATDIDLLNPNVTTASKIAYDEILRGMVDFEKISYNKTYKIADVFQLYNLIVNKNQYGGDRFTTAFKALSAPNRVLEQYFKFLGNRDYDSLFVPEYNTIDFQINAAPLVSPSAERFHSEPFIKVKDPVWDYVVKKYNAKSNTYENYELLPALRQSGIDDDTRDQRMINFAENCPFEMPNRFADLSIARTIGFKGQIIEGTPEFTQLVSALQNLNMSGKLLLLKVC